MTNEELFRGLGEVRDDLVLDAAKSPRSRQTQWRKPAALAAALALAILGILAAPGLRNQRTPIADFVSRQDRGGTQNGIGTDTVGMDGMGYESPEDAPSRPVYSTEDVTIGELDDNAGFPESAACLVWLEPEEIFAMDTAIIRGVVRDIRYFRVNVGGSAWYYRCFTVEITDCLRGGLARGDIYNVLAGGTSSISGGIDELAVGSEAVFLPQFAGADAYLEENGSRFCYADLAELYLSDGIRMLFLQTEDGVIYDSGVYPISAADGESVTLDDVWAYCASMLPREAEKRPESNSTAPKA